MTAPNQQTLLILFLPQEWKNYHRRPHWEEMARHSKILIVEPPAGILTGWLRPKRLINYFIRDRKIRGSGHNIRFFRAIQLASPGLDFMLPFLSGLDRIWMRRQLKRVLKVIKGEFDIPFSFISQVQQQHFSNLIPEIVQCYEIFDLYVIPYGHQRLDENHWYTKRARRYDKKISLDSEIVVTSSKLIFDELGTKKKNVYYLHNAADFNHFSKSAEEK
ncbi:MAG: hypothetical protein ACREBV_10790, partial [Candidatus Zixiibacteriota bacterium]